MLRLKKLHSALLCFLILSCFLSACADESEILQTDIPQEQSDSFVQELQQENTEYSQDESELKEIEVSYTIEYYDVIEDSINQFSETKVFKGEIEPKYFVEKLSELLETTIMPNEIIIKDDSMIIDFNSHHSPLSGTGSYEESKILDSITNCMFDVYKDIDKIYFTADGEEYKSGHIHLSKDIAYATRK